MTTESTCNFILMESPKRPKPYHAREPHPIFTAASKGDIDYIRHYLAEGNGANVSNLATHPGEYGNTPLQVAVLAKQTTAACMLLATGAAPNVCNGWGCTPLHFTNSIEIAEALLEAGAYPDACNEMDETPLHWAENGDMVHVLVRYGADLNAENFHCSTPLHEALNEDVLIALISHGANLEARDCSGNTPLFYAVGRHETATLAILLLEAGANPYVRNNDGLTIFDGEKRESCPSERAATIRAIRQWMKEHDNALAVKADETLEAKAARLRHLAEEMRDNEPT